MKAEDKKKKSSNKWLDKYNRVQTKKKGWNSTKKSLVDLGGAIGGTGIGATLGLFAPYVGAILLFGGHYFGDKSGVLRVVGATAIGYGVAKAFENRNSADESAVNGITMGSIANRAKDRLVSFKNDWMKAFYVDKLFESKKELPQEIDLSVGAIDLSALDAIEDSVKQSAINFEMQQSEDSQYEDEYEDEYEDDYEVGFEDEDEEEFEDEDEFEAIDYSDDDDFEVNGLDGGLYSEDEFDLSTI